MVTEIPERVELDIDEFYSRFWRTEPVVYRQLGGTVISPAVTLDEAESIRDALNPGDSRLVTRPDSQVYFINHVHSESLRLHQACTRFAQRMGWDHCTADISVSYVSGGGIGPHFDHSDNFVVQQLGEKSWQVGRPSDTPEDHQRRRMLDDEGFIPRARLSSSAPHVQLMEGDVLYIPLFAPHCGIEAGTGAAVSVSLSYNAENALTRFLGPAIEHLRDEPRWWGALPLHTTDHSVKRAIALLTQVSFDASWP